MTQTYADFATAHNLTADVTPIDNRPDAMGDGEFGQTATHYRFTLRASAGDIHTGYYSKGFGHAEAWARKHKSRFIGTPARDGLENYGQRWLPDSDYVQTIRKVAAKHVAPDVAEILESLAMDAIGSDVAFSDWCADYGYDDDSMSAKRIYDTCNEIRHALARHLDLDALGQCEEA